MMTRTPFATPLPGRTTGAGLREHEPKNQAHDQVASTSVFAGALTLPALEAGRSHSPRGDYLR
jgi:hypothetical protein